MDRFVARWWWCEVALVEREVGEGGVQGDGRSAEGARVDRLTAAGERDVGTKWPRLAGKSQRFERISHEGSKLARGAIIGELEGEDTGAPRLREAGERGAVDAWRVQRRQGAQRVCDGVGLLGRNVAQKFHGDVHPLGADAPHRMRSLQGGERLGETSPRVGIQVERNEGAHPSHCAL